MEVIIQSSFRSTSLTPQVSPDGRNIAYIDQDQQNLRILEVATLRTIRSYPLNSYNLTNLCKISQLEWEPLHDAHSQRIALLDTRHTEIQIFDLNSSKVTKPIRITEDEIFGITRFEWVQNNSHQAEHIMIFSYNKLSAKLISLEGQIYEFLKPVNDRLIKRQDGMYALILNLNASTKIVQYIAFNDTSTDPVFFQNDLGNAMNLTQVRFSQDCKWVITNDTGKNTIDLRLYPVVQPSKEPLMTYVNDNDPLGAIDVQFSHSKSSKEEGMGLDVWFSDHHECITRLRLTHELFPVKHFEHSSEIPESTVIYNYLQRSQNYVKRLGPMSLNGGKRDLPLNKRGFLKFVADDQKLYCVCNSMPFCLFIWNLSSSSAPTETMNSLLDCVLSTPSPVQDFQILQDLAIITNIDSLTIYKKDYLPLVYQHSENIKTTKVIKGSPLLIVITDQSKTGNNNHILKINTPFIEPHPTTTLEPNHLEPKEQGDQLEDSTSILFVNDVLRKDNLQKLKGRSDTSAFVELEDTFAGKRKKKNTRTFTAG